MKELNKKELVRINGGSLFAVGILIFLVERCANEFLDDPKCLSTGWRDGCLAASK